MRFETPFRPIAHNAGLARHFVQPTDVQRAPGRQLLVKLVLGVLDTPASVQEEKRFVDNRSIIRPHGDVPIAVLGTNTVDVS